MKLKALLLCLITLSSITAQAQKADKQFVIKLVDKYKKATSILYDATYKIKHFDNDDNDTVHVKGHCEMIRAPKDKDFGGYIWFDSEEDEGNTSTYYDFKNVYYIQHSKKEILKFDVSKGNTGPIKNATQASIKNTGFMFPDRILERINDKANRVKISDTLFNNENYVSIAVRFPDEAEAHDRIYTIYADKRLNEIRKITYKTYLLDQHQYDEWNLSNVKFNTVTPQSLTEKLQEYKGKYKSTIFSPPTEDDIEPLQIGNTAPGFTAKLFSSDKVISSSDYEGKILILDFWFVGCYPCALAAPHLNNLQERYKKDVVVIGLNPVDPYEKSLKKVSDYVARHKLNYTLASIESLVAKQYKIFNYPTVYIIDTNGVVQYSEMAFSEDMEKDISAVIDTLLKK
jgi:peroxiredoxin/outer membrane lipoprotein-sorting protein